MSRSVHSSRWRVGIDIGGTFTDIVALRAGGERRQAKVPTQPNDPIQSLLNALRAIDLDWSQVAQLIHGTTLVTNALVEGKIGKVALVTTSGFEDVLTIGRVSRASLYDLSQPPRLPAEVARKHCIGLDERLDHVGNVLVAPDPAAIDRLVDQIRAMDVDAVAVSLLHSYANGDHEKLVGAKLARHFKFVTLSHDLIPEAREYERSVTCVLNSGVMPRMSRYIASLEEAIPDDVQVSLFHSTGGMSSLALAKERPLSLAMSGPAAGATAAASVARTTFADLALSFDMGGTTTDVALIVDGRTEVVSAKKIGGRSIRQPMVAIESIGAGGGSIVRLGKGGLTIGPDSAGATPGPACYGNGGMEPTITDAIAIMGYLDPDRILGGSIRVDIAAAHRAFEPIAAELGISTLEVAQGVLRVSDAVMARALRRVSIERGIDARHCALIAFGGAGPMHACTLAEHVGIGRVIVPMMSGGFSAFGCLAAKPSFTAQRTVGLASAAWSDARFSKHREELRRLAARALVDAGIAETDITYNETALTHYIGQSDSIEVHFSGNVTRQELAASFSDEHERLYGYCTEEPWKIDAIRIQAVYPSAEVALNGSADGGEALHVLRHSECFFGESRTPVRVPCIAKESVRLGCVVRGPAIIEDDISTVVLPPGTAAEADQFGHLHINIHDGEDREDQQ